MMTSINPLRVYILDSDVLLRFCAKPYHPFNSSDLDSYVVGDHYTPVWQVCPPLVININRSHSPLDAIPSKIFHRSEPQYERGIQFLFEIEGKGPEPCVDSD